MQSQGFFNTPGNSRSILRRLLPSALRCGVLLLPIALNGCAWQEDSGAETSQRVTLPVSSALRKVVAYLDGLKIRYTVTLEGSGEKRSNEFTNVILTDDSVSGDLTISNLPVGTHQFLLQYIVVKDGVEIVIAEISTTFKVNAGKNQLNLFDDPNPRSLLSYPDDDNDGRNNLEELKFTWNPRAANPGQPQNVTAEALDGSVTLHWDAVPGAESYAVYMATTPGVSATNYQDADISDGMRHAVTGGTSFTHDSNLNNGVTYYFVVTAVDTAAGESLESATVTATPVAATVPAAPDHVTISARDASAVLTWDPVAGATSYSVYYAADASLNQSNWSQIGGIRITGVASPYTQANLTNGTAYSFFVSASNAKGESAASTVVQVTPVSGKPVDPITMNPDYLTANRRSAVTTGNVLLNDIDNEAQSTLSITAWTKPSAGDIAYNGDGTFTYSPRINMPSGQDSFRYTVVNTAGHTASADVQITIDPSWSMDTPHFGTDWGYLQVEYADSQKFVTRFLRNGGQASMATLDFTSGWSDFVTGTNPRTLFRLANGDLRYIYYQEPFEVVSYDYLPATNALSSTSSLYGPVAGTLFTYSVDSRRQSGGNNAIVTWQYVTSDGTTDTFHLWSRWYDGQKKSWSPPVILTTATAPHFANYPQNRQLNLYYTQAQPIAIVQATSSYTSLRFDPVSNSWSPLKDVIVDATNRTLYTYDDGAGNILAVSQLSDTVNNKLDMYANVYLASAGNWQGEKKISQDNTLRPYNVNMYQTEVIKVGNGNFDIIWESVETDYARNYWTNHYNAAGNSWLTTPFIVNDGHVKPQYVVDTQGNITLYWSQLNSAGSNYDLFARHLNAGVWQAQLTLESTDFDATAILSSARVDAGGNVHLLFKQNNGKAEDVKYKQFNRAGGGGWLPEVVLQSSAQPVVALQLYDFGGSQLQAVWNRDFGAGGQKSFSIYHAALSRQGAADAITNPVTGIPGDVYRINLYQDKAANLYLFWQLLNMPQLGFLKYDAANAQWPGKPLNLAPAVDAQTSIEATIYQQDNHFLMGINLHDMSLNTTTYTIDYR